MIARIKFLWPFAVVLALLLIWAGWALQSRSAHHLASAAQAQAARDDTGAATAYQQGVSHTQAAQQQAPVIAQDESRVGRDDAAVAADRLALAKLHPRPVPDPRSPQAPPPQSVAGPPASDPEVDALRRLSDDLTRDLTDTKQLLADTRVQLVEKTAEADAFRQSADGYQKEAGSLKVALTALQGQRRHWSAGLIYGTSQTVGAYVERDAGPFRIGADVVRRVLPAGNSTIDASARLGWTF